MRKNNSLLKTQEQNAAAPISSTTAQQRSVTSPLRHRNKSINLSVKILLVSVIAFAIACDVTMAISPENVLTRNELVLSSEKVQCEACKQKMTSPTPADVIRRLLASSLDATRDLNRREINLCGDLSLQKCRAILQKLKFLRNHQKLTTKGSENDETPLDTQVLSRHKRLAQGDRRITNLYSKTGFLLELASGKVRGSRHYTPNTLVEIRSTHQGGVISFYFPNAHRYLAMNRRGRLYGTTNYRAAECNFREEIHGSYVSYSLWKMTTKRRRRSGLKWYIGIGREGKPRKGNRIDWSNEAALFVHSNP